MNDGYLWNKTGEPDPFIDGLVAQLAIKRYQASSLNPQRVHRRPWRYLPLAAAAVLALAFVKADDDAKRSAPTDLASQIDRTPSVETTGVIASSANVAKATTVSDRAVRAPDLAERGPALAEVTAEPTTSERTLLASTTIEVAITVETQADRGLGSGVDPTANIAEACTHAPK